MSLRSDYKNSCRFCLSRILSFDSFAITDNIRTKYFHAFNLMLKYQEDYSELSCGRCVEDLEKVIIIKQRFLENQRFLAEDCLPPEKFNNETEEVINEFINETSINQEVEENSDLLPYYEFESETCKVELNKPNELIEYFESDVPIEEEIIYVEPLKDNEQGNAFPNNELLETHEEKLPQLHCIDCNKVFKSKQGLQIHRSHSHNHEMKNTFECSVCDKKFRGKRLMDNHIKIKHSEQTLKKCPLKKVIPDSQKSENKKEFIIEKESKVIKKDGKVLIECSECKKLLKKEHFKRHYEAVHLKIRPYTCDVCGRSFYFKSRVSDHLKIHFGIKDYDCDNCNLSFSSNQTLFMHKNIYHEKNYSKKCDLCGKVFNTKSYYKVHMNSKHTGERNYNCDFDGCFKSFFSSSEVNSHKKRVHSESANCSICNKRYSSEYAVKKHMKYHYDPQFECLEQDSQGNICGKKFVQNHLLMTHIKSSHRGIRDFVCGDCGVCYSSSVDLKSHILNKHQKLKIPCELCQSLMGAKSYYRRHVLTHHKELDEVTRDLLLEKIKNTKKEDLFTYVKEN